MESHDSHQSGHHHAHHHRPEHVFHISINGRPRTVTEPRLSYEEIVKLAFPGDPFDPNVIFNVSYVDPNGHEGHLVKGQSVKVHDGMSIIAGKAGRS